MRSRGKTAVFSNDFLYSPSVYRIASLAPGPCMLPWDREGGMGGGKQEREREMSFLRFLHMHPNVK